MKLHDYLLIRS